MELRSLTRISLPNDEYVYLLGMAISVFISNNGFIIENIISTDKAYSWHNLIDKESGKLCPFIAKTITEKAGPEISDLFSEIVNMRNRIIHSFRCTSSKEEQILATKDRHTGKQFDIEEEYLVEFIKLNDKLSDLLYKYRGY